MSIRCGFLVVASALMLGAGPAPAQQYYSGPGDAGVFMKPKPVASGKAAAKKPAAQRRHRALAHPSLPPPVPRSAKTKAPTKTTATSGNASATKATAAKAVPAKPTAKRSAAELPAARPSLSPPETGAAGIPDAERQRIRSALLWAGDYAGADENDAPLVAAVKHFQKRRNAKVTGALTVEQRAELLAAGDRYQRRYGWRVVIDPATGIRIGLPSRLVPKTREAPHGTHWSSPNGEVQIETFRLKQPGLTLKELYAKEKKTPSTRRMSRGSLRDDDFALYGMQSLRYFDVHAAKRDGEIRGYTLLYDQSMRGIVEPVANAMAAAFAPFPARTMPFAVLDTPVEYGTGLVVGAHGAVIADPQMTDGCKVIVVAGLGNADRIAEDKPAGLALLRVYGQHKLPVLPLPRAAAPAASKAKVTRLTLLGVPDPKQQQGGAGTQAITARLAGNDAIDLDYPAPLAGLSGAAVLGPDGGVLGMMQTRKAMLASNGPPPAPVHLVTVAAIRNFLHTHGVTPASGGEAHRAVVRVICVRK